MSLVLVVVLVVGLVLIKVALVLVPITELVKVLLFLIGNSTTSISCTTCFRIKNGDVISSGSSSSSSTINISSRSTSSSHMAVVVPKVVVLV